MARRKKEEITGRSADTATQPFLYEIRVRGRLSDEQWTSWFDNLTVTTEKGETILRGILPDHSALYGLLSRLRDLAVPLLAVNVLDAEAQRKLFRKNTRYNVMITLLLITIYLLLMGGVITVTVFLSAENILHTGLAMTIMFAAIGGLAYAFALWSGHRIWEYLSWLMWPASLITFFVYVASAQILPTALAIAILLFLIASGLIYWVYALRGRAERIDNALAGWEKLGTGSDNNEDNLQ